MVMVIMMDRRYSELKMLRTYEERFEYLKLTGSVGVDTFGFDRIFNQTFYRSQQWKDIRRQVIIRDEGLDMGLYNYPINGHILVHHMNPITLDDLTNYSKYLIDPEYMICVSHATHNAIHYGSDIPVSREPIERKPNDTCPWRNIL